MLSGYLYENKYDSVALEAETDFPERWGMGGERKVDFFQRDGEKLSLR